jgi:hypothetical protein
MRAGDHGLVVVVRELAVLQGTALRAAMDGVQLTHTKTIRMLSTVRTFTASVTTKTR